MFQLLEYRFVDKRHYSSFHRGSVVILVSQCLIRPSEAVRTLRHSHPCLASKDWKYNAAREQCRAKYARYAMYADHVTATDAVVSKEVGKCTRKGKVPSQS